ncbi:MAG: hypothetical protein C5B51_13705 [Terriglobia bacterium]|nr:MAG: hypothetical protein C5B51_13705 [Terriglobia bacterium]
MNCGIDGTTNIMNGGFACARDIFDWAAEVIQKAFRQRARVARETPAMESMSLEQGLSCLKDEFPRGSRFRVFVSGQPKALNPVIQGQIFLIAREALINALRHSEATIIEAEVEYRPRRLQIRVRDNGRGIDPKTVRLGRHGHWGLVGMRESATQVGAQFQIWSRPGSGTEVEISVSGQMLAEAYA